MRTVPFPLERPLYESTTLPSSNNTDLEFSNETIQNLRDVEEKYTSNLAGKTYDQIPNSNDAYVALYYALSQLQLSTQNANLRLLFKITQEGLKGAVNAFGLNTDVVELNIKNLILQNQINDILSGKNELELQDNASGQFVITKSFVLAPVFSYYIALFGMPRPGVGFN